MLFGCFGLSRRCWCSWCLCCPRFARAAPTCTSLPVLVPVFRVSRYRLQARLSRAADVAVIVTLAHISAEVRRISAIDNRRNDIPAAR